MVGWVSMSKKSTERRWASRFSSRVVIELRSTSAETDEPSTTSSPMVMVPEKVEKFPFTFETMRWRTLNPTSECEASMVQVPAGICGVVMGCS